MKKSIIFMLVIFVSAALIIAGCGKKDSTEKAPTQVIEQNFQPVNIEKNQGTHPEGSKVIIADFDSGDKPNKIGGNFGAWDKDPTDFSQGCIESFDSVNRRGVKGFAMKIDYDVDSQSPAYNGFWMFLQNLDASKYDNLAFWVKGDGKEGYTTVFKVELKNDKRQVGRYYITNVTDKWQKIIVPFSDLKGINDFSGLTEFVIVFEDRIASNKDGVIYIDDISFTKN